MLTIQPAFFEEKNFSFFTLCFGIMIFWLGRKSYIKENENGSFFPNHNLLIPTVCYCHSFKKLFSCSFLIKGNCPHSPNKNHQGEKYQDFLKWGGVYQGFTQALFAATIFDLRLSLKCRWGPGWHCKLWLKQHSYLLKPLVMALFSGCDK